MYHGNKIGCDNNGYATTSDADGCANYSYAADAKPFYVLLFLLVIEKFSIQWTKDRFGCDDKQMKIFKSIDETEKSILDNTKKLLEEKNKLKADNISADLTNKRRVGNVNIKLISELTMIPE